MSLDFCADQYVLRFAKRENILALSPDADKSFSYMRDEAGGLDQVRPRSADVLALAPDLVVRSYGGGPRVAGFLERAGVDVVQIGYPGTLDEVREEIVRLGTALGEPDRATELANEFSERLAAIELRSKSKPETHTKALYMTPGGVTTGEGSLVHELMSAAGLANFQTRPGWNAIPLERLAYERPELVVASFFDTAISGGDNWSAARHPIAQAQLRELPVASIQGAWTSCGGWFLVEAVETMAEEAGKP